MLLSSSSSARWMWRPPAPRRSKRSSTSRRPTRTWSPRCASRRRAARGFFLPEYSEVLAAPHHTIEPPAAAELAREALDLSARSSSSFPGPGRGSENTREPARPLIGRSPAPDQPTLEVPIRGRGVAARRGQPCCSLPTRNGAALLVIRDKPPRAPRAAMGPKCRPHENIVRIIGCTQES